jgi:hypothetical protein
MKGDFKMILNIKKITAVTGIFLSSEQKPINRKHLVWYTPTENGEEEIKEIRGSKYPVAFLLDQKSPAHLIVTIQLSGHTIGHHGKLKGYYKKSNLIFFQSKEFRWEKGKSSAQVDVYAPGTPPRFWRFLGELTWEYEHAKKKYCIGKTYLDLYWIYGYNSELFKDGIPIEILRQVSYSLRIIGYKTWLFYYPFSHKKPTKLNPYKDPAIMAVVNTCFFRTPPAYNIKNQGGYFVSNTGDNIIFYLGDYLKAIHEPTSLCNCYDLSAAVQIFLNAIGLKNVRTIYMDPFGYIKFSKLVGHGLCNNPADLGEFDLDLGNDMIVDETFWKREQFSSHEFCCLPDEYGFTKNLEELPKDFVKHSYCDYYCRNCRVLDACIGPHTGFEDIDKYVKNTIDKIVPPGVNLRQPKINEIKDRLITIDWNRPVSLERPNPRTEAFRKILDYSEKEIPYNDYSKIFTWQNHMILNKVEETMGTGWEKFGERIIPGSIEVLKTLKLKRDGAVIQLDLFIFHHKNLHTAFKSAQYRFLELGSLSTLPIPPYKKIEDNKTRWYIAAICQSKNYSEFLGTIYNIACRIKGRYTSTDVLPLSESLLDLESKEFDITSYKKNLNPMSEGSEGMSMMHLPVPLEVNDRMNDMKTIKVGEEVIIPPDLETDNVLMDFSFGQEDNDMSDEVTGFPGVQLVKKEDTELTFLGCRKSTNMLTVSTVDKDTLLCRSRKVTIKVVE